MQRLWVEFYAMPSDEMERDKESLAGAVGHCSGCDVEQLRMVTPE
jgi:hypothetical protein